MRIAIITSGAAGMYCGSCMKDNTLAGALIRQGHDALLIPTYTPIRTDEEDVSQQRVFFGGINVFLQQKSWLFRHTPWFLDRLLNFPRLLRWVSRFAVKTQPDKLGPVTISMLKGKDGKQRKEVNKLVRYLKQHVQPEAILLSNVLISGMVAELRSALDATLFGIVQGDDIYLESLPADDRRHCIELIRKNCESLDGLIATSVYYADFMANYLGVPRQKIHVVHPGIRLKGHGSPRVFRDQPPYTIGYFARICPEKGFHLIAEAFRILRQKAGAPACHLRVSGWLGENYRAYFETEMEKLRKAGLGDAVEHVPSPDHAGKIGFLQSLDVLSVPSVYREPKGIYMLEALANGVPVVEPRHGSFPELIEATGGGLLVEPNDPAALAEGIQKLLEDVNLRRDCGERGQAAVRERFSDDRMASATMEVFERVKSCKP